MSASAGRRGGSVLIGFPLVLGTAISRSLQQQIGASQPIYVSEVASHIAAGDLLTDMRLLEGDTRSVLHTLRTMPW